LTGDMFRDKIGTIDAKKAFCMAVAAQMFFWYHFLLQIYPDERINKHE